VTWTHGQEVRSGARDPAALPGSKTAQVVAMPQRENGVTLSEIVQSMRGQKHTVRGFMAGAMKKAGTPWNPSSQKEASVLIA